VLLVLATVAVNCCVWDGLRETVKGEIVTVIDGFSVTVAEALLVVSATLVAVTVTVCWLAMLDGAV